MWSIICFLFLLAIGVMVGVVVLWVAWQIVRLILNLICGILFGEGEVF